MTDPYEKLAEAIVLNAVKDYRKALHTLKYHPKSAPANKMKVECEKFFLSGWFCELCTLDGEDLIRKLKEEAQ